MAANLSVHRSSDFGVQPTRSSMTYALWTAQGLLAALFLITGITKFITPPEALTAIFPAGFIRFIGVCEVLGAFGLILPGALNIRRGLTPLAASGLVIIMSGAVVTTIAGIGVAQALFPSVVGLSAASVAYGRRSWSSAGGGPRIAQRA